MLQRHAVQKLHGNERFAVLVVNFVDRADVGMIQRRGGLGLALETAEGLRVFGYVVGQELEGHKPAEFDILSLIHHTHSATADLLYDAVVRNGFANQRVGGWHVPHILGFCEMPSQRREVIAESSKSDYGWDGASSESRPRSTDCSSGFNPRMNCGSLSAASLSVGLIP